MLTVGAGVASDLEHAIEQGHLEVHYQPTYSLVNRRIDGAEALVRWRHPTRGLVGPKEFVPAAEQSNQIIRLGHWVLTQACEDALGWQKRHPSTPPRYVSVNLSGRQLADPGIVNTVRAVLTRSGLDPSALVLEVTESMLIHDVPTASALMGALRQAHVRFAIDDFGSGYSSLAHLWQLPVDILKIDQVFTNALGRGPRGEAVLRAIIAMASELRLGTIAEGIEDEAQENRLRWMGCQIGQGFLFARPMPVSDFDALLGRENQARDEDTARKQ